MHKRERLIVSLPLAETAQSKEKEANCIEVTVRYALGGINYFSGDRDPRGYYLGATPLTRREGFTSFVMFSGIKVLLQPADRFSEKVLHSLVVPPDRLDALVRRVCEKNGVELVQAASSGVSVH